MLQCNPLSKEMQMHARELYLFHMEIDIPIKWKNKHKDMMMMKTLIPHLVGTLK